MIIKSTPRLKRALKNKLGSRYIMGLILLQADLPGMTNTAMGAVESTYQLVGDWKILIVGIILIIVAVLIIYYIQKIIAKIIINSVLGLIAWAILFFVLKIELQLIPSLVVSVIFGLAGIGAILILKFLGIPI